MPQMETPAKLHLAQITALPAPRNCDRKKVLNQERHEGHEIEKRLVCCSFVCFRVFRG